MRLLPKPFQRLIGPLLIVVVALIAYLPHVTKLGYYRDDWHVTWGWTVFGAAKIIDLHLTDRPVMGLIYSLTYSILGNSPLVWQLYIITLRIVDGLLLLWLLRLIWPNRRMATTLMAMLFTIYPGFLQMPTSSAYSNHFFGLGMGILSLALTVKALQVSRRWLQILLVLVSIGTGLVCFLIMEYMISLEGVRILLLGYLFVLPQSGTILKKCLRLLKLWLPYCTGLFAFLIWRLLIFKSARSTTDVGSLAGSYLAEPGYMLARIIIETTKGMLNALFMAWSVPFYNQTMTANPVNLFAAFVLMLAAIVALIAFLRFSGQQNDLRVESLENCQWGKQAALVGLLITLINIIPVVLANRDIRLTDTLDRYTLPASIGVVIFFVGTLYWMVRSSLRLPVIAALVGISIFTHYNNTAFFMNFWAMEKQLWWQLSWRAPDLKPNTVLIPSLPQPYMLAESYEVWGPANLIYGTREAPLQIVGEAINAESMLSIITRGSFDRTMRRVRFTLDFKNSLVVSIPTPGSCLRIHDGDWLEYAENESLLVRQVAPLSNSSLIITEGSPKTPPVEIFGQEPEHTWCYYYERAALPNAPQVRLFDRLGWLPTEDAYIYPL